jgi:hypothetical protein
MENSTENQQKIELIKELADIKRKDIDAELSVEEFDSLYDLSIDELLVRIQAIKTLIGFRNWLAGMARRV